MNNRKVYLDYAATTPVDPLVWSYMTACVSEYFGNPSSIHSYGVEAKALIENARAGIAEKIGCHCNEIVFTSGGTESNNLAIKGVALGNQHKGHHIIVSSIEHDSILNACKWLENQGFYISYLPVNEYAEIDLELLDRLINPKTILVSIMHVNNETGTMFPIVEISKLCKNKGVYFHTDACQSFGKISLPIGDINLVSINSHKIYGPKGIGALIIKGGVTVAPLLHGGGQEMYRRSSTENVTGIAGFAAATDLCYKEFKEEYKRQLGLRTYMVNQLHDKISGIYFNGKLQECIPNIVNFGIAGLEGEMMRLMLMLDTLGIAISSGSACSSNSTNHASHVLKAMGNNPVKARGSVRVSFGRFVKTEDIDFFVQSLHSSIKKLNPIYTDL